MYMKLDFYVKVILFGSVLINILFMIIKGTLSPIQYDESYNMQVVNNLHKFNFYATMGSLLGHNPWQFDPHITTGPFAICIMLAVYSFYDNPIVALKLYGALIFISLLLSLSMFHYKKHSILALIGLFLISLSDAEIPLFQFIGEPMAAILIVIFAVFLISKRTLAAGLVAGLVFETKLQIGIALLLFGMIYVYINFDKEQKKKSRTISFFIGFLTPVLMMTLYVLSSAVDIYIVFIDFVKFMLSQRSVDNPALNAFHVLTYIYKSINASIIIIASISTTKILIEECRQWRRSRRLRWQPAYMLKNRSGVLVVLVMFATILANNTNNIGQRTVLIATSIVVPIGLLVMLEKAFSPRIVQILIVILLFQNAYYKYFETISALSRYNIFSQIAVADTIKDMNVQSLYVDGWWQNPEYVLLTGIHGVPKRTLEPQVLLVQDYEFALRKTSIQFYEDICDQKNNISEKILVCTMKTSQVGDIHILDYGPSAVSRRFARYFPNVLWYTWWGRLEPIDFSLIGPVRSIVNHRMSSLAVQDSTHMLVTGIVPALATYGANSLEISIRATVDQREWRIGTININ